MRKTVIASLSILCIGFVIYRIVHKPVCPDCNVILITVDSVTRDHLGTFGYQRNTSPNLDSWAKGAQVYTGYTTTSNLTPITQTSIQTGLYPSNSGMVSFSTKLPTNVPTMAELLKKSGYETAAIGSAPEYFADGSAGWQARRETFERGFDQFFTEYFDYQIASKSALHTGNWTDYRFPEVDRGLPLSAVDWLKNSPKQKFFLWIPVGSVHWPYNDSKPFHFAQTAYNGILSKDHLNWRLPSVFRRVYNDYIWQEDGTKVPLTKEDKQFIIDRYDDGIYITDQFLGELFKTLQKTGLNKKTIVIVTTEHGEQFGEHGYYAHYDIFDSEIQTPLIVSYPGMASGRPSALVSSVDILPSVFDLLGISKPWQLDGKSFVNILTNRTPDTPVFRPYVFTERTPLMETLMYDPVTREGEFLKPFIDLDDSRHFRDVSVRTKEWKLIYRESKAIQDKYSWWRWLSGNKNPIPDYELYHIPADPKEQHDVLTSNPVIVNKLKNYIRSYIRATGTNRQHIGPNQADTYL